MDEGKPGGRPKLGFRTLVPNTSIVLEVRGPAQPTQPSSGTSPAHPHTLEQHTLSPCKGR